MSDYYHGIVLKPSIVLIEKWIASNEGRKDDDEIVSYDVDNEEISSATNKDVTSNNGDSGVNGEKLFETLETIYDEDGKAVRQVQQLTNESAFAAPLQLDIGKKPKPLTSERKSKKKDRRSRSRRSKFDSKPRVSSYLIDDTPSDQIDHTVVVRNDIEREQGSSEKLSTCNKIDGEIIPQHFPIDMNETEHERPISVATNNNGDTGRRSHSYDDGAIANGHFPGGQADLHQNNYVHRNDHRSNSEYADFREDEHQSQNQSSQPQIQFVDDDEDNDQPIDYSMRVPRDHNSTVHPIDSMSFVSPAAALRTGFAYRGFLPYPARSHIDNQRRTFRSDVYYPAAKPAFARPSISDHSRRSISDLVATSNGDAAHTSGTIKETVDASTQTDVERTGYRSCEENCYRIFSESNNNFLLMVFNQCFNTMALMANGGSPNSSSIQTQSQNAISNTNLSDLRLSNVEVNDKETQAATNRRRTKKVKKTRGIPQKRSQRILDMAARKEKEFQNVDEAEVPPPKKAKTDFHREFEVENVSNSENVSQAENVSNPADATEDSRLEIVPRKLTFSTKVLSFWMETPRRPSSYIQKKNDLARKLA